MFLFFPVLEKSEFKDESQFFRFYADEETEGTSTKSKQLQRNDFKLIENILAKSLVVSWNTRARCPHAQVLHMYLLCVHAVLSYMQCAEQCGKLQQSWNSPTA